MAQSVRFERAINFLHQRKRAYQLCFGIRLNAWFKRGAYRIVFGGPAGQQVLRDLAIFCRADETCFHADPRKHAVLEGRREVWLRITDHMNLSHDQLYSLYSGHQSQENTDA